MLNIQMTFTKCQMSILREKWVSEVPNYKEMYLKMVRASEHAINILIAAQQECEELYLSEPELTVFPDKEKASERGGHPGAER